MKVKNGDFASAIDALTSRPSGGPSTPLGEPRVPGPSPTAGQAGAVDATPQELTELGLQPQPEAGASLRFPPQAEDLSIRRTQDRPRWQRLLRSLAVWALLMLVMLVYVGTMADADEGPGGVFAALFALSWLLPLVVWFRSRHLSAQVVAVRGYAVGVLASVPVFGGVARVDLMTSDDDQFDPDELLPLAGVSAPAAVARVSAATDLAFELSDLLVKPRHGRADGAGADALETPHAEAAVQRFCKSLSAALGVAPASVLAAYPELSDDLPDGQGGALTFIWIVVRGGQALGLDAVCQAIAAAADQVLADYEVTSDD